MGLSEGRSKKDDDKPQLSFDTIVIVVAMVMCTLFIACTYAITEAAIAKDQERMLKYYMVERGLPKGSPGIICRGAEGRPGHEEDIPPPGRGGRGGCDPGPPGIMIKGPKIRDPVPVNDRYDLHYWTCRDSKCEEVFRGMLGQYEISECTAGKCRTLVGDPTHIWYPNEPNEAYEFWALGDDENDEFYWHRLGALGSKLETFSLHECTKSSCQRLAFWTASNVTK